MSIPIGVAAWCLWLSGSALLALVAATDIRRRRVANWAVAAGSGAGLCLHGLAAGAPGLRFATLGLAAGAVWWVPSALCGLGAGDVKLAMAVGALWGARCAFLGPACGLCALAGCLPPWIAWRRLSDRPWRGLDLPVAPWIALGSAAVAVASPGAAHLG